MIDLAPERLEAVRRILARHAPGREVCAFGSRVTGRARIAGELEVIQKAH